MKLRSSPTKMKREGVNGHPGLILLPILKVLTMPPLRHIIAIIAFLNNKSTIPMNWPCPSSLKFFLKKCPTHLIIGFGKI
jgi:hypothetical protein